MEKPEQAGDKTMESATPEVSRRQFVSGVAAALGYVTATTDAELNTLIAADDATRLDAGPRKREWHQLKPDLFAMVYLVFLRDWLRNANLYDTEEPPLSPVTGDPPNEYLRARTLDGTWNDLRYPTMGAACRRFGRNVPLNETFPDPLLMEPNPRTVSVELMTRNQFKPATSINLLAAAWIQFQVHDWFAHEQGTDADSHRVPVPMGDSWPHGSVIEFPRTPVDPPPTGSTRPPAYKNEVPHWWDGSQIYGADAATNDAIRTKCGGMIRVRSSGLLEVDPRTRREITGFMPNGWMGVSLLHGVFALEHNAICAHLAKKYPTMLDEELYHKGRLIVAALMAKIHTIEWTLAALQTNVLRAAMETNWHGFLGPFQQISKAFQDSELLGGIVGSPTDHHTAPYAMTEEFASVYRMHPLMPDQFTFYSAKDGSRIEEYELPDLVGDRGRSVLDRYENKLTDVYYTLGISHPGAITLQNYPRHLQDLTSDGKHLDLAVVEIVRDRERGIPRYNAFRRLLGKPPVVSFSDVTPDRALAERLERVYGHVDRIDTLVGLLAEVPPERFAFSETAFRIFILMASRRLKSDRFYTQPYWDEQTYTKEGLEWIEKNSMATVLRRHFPSLRSRIGKGDNAFRPWKQV